MSRRQRGTRVYIAADVDAELAAAMDAEAERRDLSRADIIREWLRRGRPSEEASEAEPKAISSAADDEAETDAA